MRIEQANRDGYVVLTLVGRLDLAAAPQIHRALLEHLGQQPSAILCDLVGVEAIDPVCAGVFSSLRHPELGWPDTVLAVCGARPAVAAVLTRHQVPGLRVYGRCTAPWTRRLPTPARDRRVCGSG